MRKVSLLFGLLLTLTLMFGSTALAQAPFVLCGDLSEADCSILEAAQAAAMELHSASTEFNLAISISNIPYASYEELNFNLSGTGSYAVDPALMDRMMALQSDPSALFADPEGLVPWFVDLIQGTSANLSLALDLPPELIEALASEGETIPQPLTLELRLVDGFGYINLDDIAAALPNADIPPGWIGIDLATLIERGMEQGGFNSPQTMDPEILQNYMQDLQDPELVSEFMTIERLADTTVMGQPAAVFRYTFDYVALLQSEAFREMMQAQMEAVGEAMGEEFDDEAQAEMDEALDMMGPMFEGFTFEIQQVIGLEDYNTYTSEIHIVWDMAGLMATIGEETDGPAPLFTFDMTVNNSNFNIEPQITAPEDATIFPLNMMMPSPEM
ncbi:MAG TPA: hypothetical protein VKY59_07400 [Spirillospora sp.]|nr:hypothetical protein [Spirillospora sp.]